MSLGLDRPPRGTRKDAESAFRRADPFGAGPQTALTLHRPPSHFAASVQARRPSPYQARDMDLPGGRRRIGMTQRQYFVLRTARMVTHRA